VQKRICCSNGLILVGPLAASAVLDVSESRSGPTPRPMAYEAASRPFLLFRFALREGDFVLAELIARALRRRRRRA
jgi:hypothetical protein